MKFYVGGVSSSRWQLPCQISVILTVVKILFSLQNGKRKALDGIVFEHLNSVFRSVFQLNGEMPREMTHFQRSYFRILSSLVVDLMYIKYPDFNSQCISDIVISKIKLFHQEILKDFTILQTVLKYKDSN